jgi:hypothetical protein
VRCQSEHMISEIVHEWGAQVSAFLCSLRGEADAATYAPSSSVPDLKCCGFSYDTTHATRITVTDTRMSKWRGLTECAAWHARD